MALITDNKTTYFDGQGKPLSNGQLKVCLLGTQTTQLLYADKDFTVELTNPYGLNSGGWTNDQLFAKFDATVFVYKLIGHNELDEPILSLIKNYDVFVSDSGGSNVSGTVVDTLADLKMIEPTDKMVVSVKGYYSAKDLFIRSYIYNSTSMALGNDGTIVTSAVEPDGRWILKTDSDVIPIGIFGVIAGSTENMTSQWRASQDYCSLVGKTLYIPQGTYNLTGGGSYDSYCKIRSDKGVVFTATASHSWNLYNPDCMIDGSLTGLNVHLVIQQPSLSDTCWSLSKPIPISAWYYKDDILLGTGKFNLLADNSSAVVIGGTAVKYINSVVIPDGLVVSLSTAFDNRLYAKYLQSESGVYTISAGSYPIRYGSISTHNLSGTDSATVGIVLSKATTEITLDSVIQVSSGSVINATIRSINYGTLQSLGNVSILGGIMGNSQFLVGAGSINFGTTEIVADWFLDPDGLINSFNISNRTFLDMRGLVSTVSVSKDNSHIINGSIGGFTGATKVTLESMTITGQILASEINMHKCKMTFASVSPMPNISSGVITFSTVTNSGTSVTINSHYTTQTNVIYEGNINLKQIGGGSIFTNVYGVVNLTCVPDPDGLFENFCWIGGSASKIDFNASITTYSGSCTATNVYITGIQRLINNINTINGATKKWAINGHSNINIFNNENARSTKGATRQPWTFVSTSDNGGHPIHTGTLPIPDLFVFSYGVEGVEDLKAVQLIATMAPTSGNNVWVAIKAGVDGKINGSTISIGCLVLYTQPPAANGTNIMLTYDIYPRT